VIEAEQRFLSSIDGTYKPPVQNFYVVSPELQTVTIDLTTSRFLLNYGKTDFEKTHQGYFYKGELSGNFEVGLCTSSIPSSLYKHNTRLVDRCSCHLIRESSFLFILLDIYLCKRYS